MDKEKGKVLKYLVNAETGEQERELRSGDIVVIKEFISFSSLEPPEEIKKPFASNMVKLKYESFLKVRFDRLLFFSKSELKLIELKLLFFLLSHLKYNRVLISYSNGQPISKEYVAEQMGLSLQQVEKGLRALRREGIIKIGYTKLKPRYYINPYVAYRGTHIDRDILTMFDNTKWAKTGKNTDKND